MNNLDSLCKDFLKEKAIVDNFEKKTKKEYYAKFEKLYSKNSSLASDLYKIQRVDTSKVEYDIDKLKENLKKDEFKAIVNKEVKVTNSFGLINFFKQKGISLSEVKGFIELENKVDENVLTQDIELGKIDAKVISKCIKVTNNSYYYKISEKEKE